jgi:hypothetical protein
LLVTYEPDGAKDTYTSSSYTGPRTISKIWDITENSDFDFEVPFMAPTGFLHTNGMIGQFTDRGVTLFNRPTLPNTWYYNDADHNGTIIVSVLNALTSMDPSKTAYLFIRMNAKDVEFANPRDIELPLSNYALQSGEEVAHMAAEPGVPQTSNVTHKVHPGQLVYTGEVVRSIRTLLHRTNYYDRVPMMPMSQTPNAVYTSMLPSVNYATFTALRAACTTLILPHLPMMPGNMSGIAVGNVGQRATIRDDGNVNFQLYGQTIETPTMTAYFAGAYVGSRGSTVYHAKVDIPPVQDADRPVVTDLSISRFTRGLTTMFSQMIINLPFLVDYVTDSTYIGVTSIPNRFGLLQNALRRMRKYVSAGHSGFTVTNQDKVNVIDAVVPYYSNFRMMPANPIGMARMGFSPNDLSWNYYDKTPLNNKIAGIALNTMIEFPRDVTLDAPHLVRFPTAEIYHKAGVDFSLFKYLNPPTLFCYKLAIDGYLDQYP